MRFPVAAAISLAILVSSAKAQTAPAGDSQSPTFKAGGEEVVVDVVVRDKKGHLIKDLKSDNFRVLDNGQQRPIKTFRLVEGREAVSSSGARTQLDPLRQIRLVTLIYQLSSNDANARRLAKDASLDLIKNDLGQNVYMAVMTIDHRLEAIQSFTNDRELLRKAIDRATGGGTDFGSDSTRVTQQLEQMLGPATGGDMSLAGRVGALSNGSSDATGPNSAPQGAAAADQAMAGMMLHILQSQEQDMATDFGRSSIYSLLDAVKEQYRLPGRKTLLYFSEGFSVPQSAEEAFNVVIATANRSNVSFYPIDARGLTTQDTNRSSINGLNDAAAASRANSVNHNGVTTDMANSVDKSIDSGRRDTQNTLDRLAAETGGTLIANTNDFRGPIRRINEDIETYYEISYNPEITNYDGSFHKIAVKADSSDLRVQSRSGYFALPPALAAGGQVLSAIEVPLMNALNEKPMPHNFGFQTQGMHFRGAGPQPTCDVVVDIPISSMTLQENKTSGLYEGSMSYVALVKNSQGEVVKKLHEDVPLRITADKLKAYQDSHFIRNENFELSPGRYTLETAVIDRSAEKVSARKASFLIPAQGTGISISSVAVVRSVKPKDTATKPNDPMLMSAGVVTPMVSPTLKKTDYDNLPFYVVIYPDKANTEKPSLKMIFSKDGQQLGAGSPALTEPDAEGRIQYVATAPLATLQPGNYQVKFVAQQGKEAAAETVTFTLE